MKILYAIQGTGNGHLSRAGEIIPFLQQKGELDILVSGTESDIRLQWPVKYQLKGLSFVFGKKGGVDILQTYKKARLRRLRKEIASVPVEMYDIVINDFEPVSAWACKLAGVPCIGLSHQSGVTDRSAPQPQKKDLLGWAILKNYAPVSKQYGFHFKVYNEHIFTPVIRSQVRKAEITDHGHITVYLPAYADELIISVLSTIDQVSWEVYSKNTMHPYSIKHIEIYPITNDSFVNSMASSAGVLCGAGFETPAEALFMRKKLMVIPMKGQYEQQCNAAALKEMGVPVIKKLSMKHIERIISWINFSSPVNVYYPDMTASIIDHLFHGEQLPFQTGTRKILASQPATR